MSGLFLSLSFLCLIIIPENGANLKRYYQHSSGSTSIGPDGLITTGPNWKLLDSQWNGTFVSIPGGHVHPSTATEAQQTSSSSLSSSGSGGGKQQQQSPLNIDIRMGFMMGSARKPGDKEYSRPGLTIAGGLTYALYTLQHSKFFTELSQPVNINFLLTVAETFGDEDTSIRQVARLWKEHNVSVIIGPQETCLHEARLSSSLNIPMISYFCSDEATSDKRHFPTFSRSRPPDAAITRAVASLVLNYGWCDSLTVIYSDSSDDQRFKRVAKSLSLLFRERGVSTHPEMSYTGPYHIGYGDNPFDAIVQETKETTRIYIIISEYFEHLGLVLALKKHDLLENGEYLVIGVSMDDFQDGEWNPYRYFHGLLTDENETEAPSAFRSYLGIVPSAPKDFKGFSHHVNHFMEMEPFHFKNSIRDFGGFKNIRIEAAFLYDAVMLYAHVIRDILQEYFSSVFSAASESGSGSGPNNEGSHSRSTSRRNNDEQQSPPPSQQRLIPPGIKPKLAIRHRRDHVSVLSSGGSQSAPGSSSRVNNSLSGNMTAAGGANNRNKDVVDGTLDEKGLLDKIRDGREVGRRLRKIRYHSATGHETKMDENGDAEGNFTLVALKSKNDEFGLYPVGFFMRSTNQLPELTLTETIDWVAGSPPVSQPECGFHGEKCESDTFSMWALGTGLLSLTFLMSAMYLVFRHWRLSRDMDALLWRIDKKDIEWETGRLFPAVRGGRGQLMGCGGLSTGSQASLAKFSSVFAPLVSYRERIFAAKALNVCNLDAGLKHQLKMLREIRHENLNAFIGACVFDEGLLLVYEYCSRGSIKDILENGDLKLDDMFVSSLVGDLLRGLSYLHDSSPFRYHGNLKPSNCLIDSRWNLKLSDFGLKPYEYKLRRTTDLIVPPTCNLASSTGGMVASKCAAAATAAAAAEMDDNIGPATPTLIPNQNYGQGAGATGGGGGSGGGRASQSFTSSFHGHVLSQVTSPYLSPEYPLLIKSQIQKSCVEGLRRGDIYSLGIILWELIRRESLSSYLGIKEDKEIRERICHGISVPFQSSSKMSTVTVDVDPDELFWPTTLQSFELPCDDKKQQLNGKSAANNSSGINHFDQIRECLKDCLSVEPETRPDIKAVRMRLRPLHKGMRSNIFDIMIGLMEKYANNLEILVDERTKQLSEEKRKTESLLYELIPASVAEELKDGLQVPAQNYDCVSIYFSDIVGFTSMSAQSTPLQVVEFLNDLYTCFDFIIESFDVYKVETIGDAYMVASGLPDARPDNFHAIEVGNMALKLLQAVTNFRIRHRPNETLKLRIGIHAGPVCAGVVGLKRPRYCLFGDTVNTASRMESTGLPLRIHCSETFANLIQDDPNPQFELEERGLIDVKGKGDMKTYWLKGKRTSPPSTVALILGNICGGAGQG